MKNPEAVIFDMDGVLVDSEPIHCEIERRLFSKLGIAVPEETHRSYLGTATDFMYTDIKTRFDISFTISELMEIDEAFRCDYFDRTAVFILNEGVLDLLKEIKLAGLKLAVATSSSPELVKIVLNRCEIASFFDAVVTASEAGKSKPEADVYLLAAHKIGVEPANCIVFEDSPNGISAAKGAGMPCIAFQTDSVGIKELSKADFVVRTFRGIGFDRLIEIAQTSAIELSKSQNHL